MLFDSDKKKFNLRVDLRVKNLKRLPKRDVTDRQALWKIR